MADEKEKVDDQELEIVGEAAEEGSKEIGKADKKEAADEKEDGEEEERATGHSEDDEEEAPRKKKSRHERDRASRARDKREIEYLTVRNQQLEQRFGQLEARTEQNERVAIDQRISTLRTQIETADEVIAAAIEKGNGKEEREANRIRERLKDSLGRLETHKSEIEAADREGSEGRDERAPQQRKQVPVEVVVNARVWMKANPWYKPGARDPDSREVKEIDDAMVAEGYDPRDEDYWDELTNRVKEALPHRFEEEGGEEERPAQKIGKKSKGGGPRFSTGGRGPELKPNQVHVSAARKAAMVEAGVWEDPKLRQKYLKSYAKYDRENASRS
jgi:hypothetical protein